MQFCPKCSALLVPKKDERKVVLSCSCGYTSNKKEDTILTEKVALRKQDRIEIADKKAEVLPKTEEICPKCGHHEAYYWTVQTRAGDEAETRFFKCVKCLHTWRVY